MGVRPGRLFVFGEQCSVPTLISAVSRRSVSTWGVSVWAFVGTFFFEKMGAQGRTESPNEAACVST